MYICRLFRSDRPAEQIDARLIASGALTIGRDPKADWPLDDPDGLLSRIHCTLSVEEGALRVHDSSTNGTFVDGTKRVPRDTSVPLADHQSVRIGSLTLIVDRPRVEAARDGTVVQLPPALPVDWAGAPNADTPPHPDASLLEAFCEGARLDVSTFSNEDPAALMRRLGGIYRQSVAGLSALMAQRTHLKNLQEIDRTTVSAGRNNPVKWTSPRRLAEDLLRDRDAAFLSGEDAVAESFLDLTAHLSAMATGVNAAIATLLDQLDPEALAREAALIPGFSLRSRAAARLTVHADRHRALREGGAARTFRDAYCAADIAGVQK